MAQNNQIAEEVLGNATTIINCCENSGMTPAEAVSACAATLGAFIAQNR